MPGFNDNTWLQQLRYYTGNHSSGGNAIKVIADLGSGTGILGIVGIDQTTPGTTNGVSVTSLPSGTETPTASLVTNSTGSPVAAGKLSVTFTTDSSFVGTILGVVRNASTIYSFSVTNPGKTLAAITYTVTAGSMIIDVIV